MVGTSEPSSPGGCLFIFATLPGALKTVLDRINSFCATRKGVETFEDPDGAVVFLRWGPRNETTWDFQRTGPSRGVACCAPRIQRDSPTHKFVHSLFSSAAECTSREEFNGPLALLSWDARRGVLSALVDAINLHPLFRSSLADLILVSDDADALVRFLGVGATPSPSAISAYIERQTYAFGRFIKEVAPLPPGCVTRWHGGRLSYRNYWRPVPIVQPTTFEESCEELWHRVKGGVRLATNGATNIAAELSGGLDSGGVCCALDDLVTQGDASRSATAVSAVFPNHVCDESARINEVKSHFISLAHQTWNGAEVSPLDLPEPGLAWPDSGVSGVLGVAERSLLVQLRCDTLLSGFGGDQMFEDRAVLLDYFSANDAPGGAAATFGFNHHRLKPFLGALRRKLLPHVRVKSSLGSPQWAQGAEALQVPQIDLPQLDSAVGNSVFQVVRGATMAAQVMKRRVAWHRAGVECFMPLLSPNIISWLVMIEPRKRVNSPLWRNLWRAAIARRTSNHWALSPSKMKFSPIVIDRFRALIGAAKEIFTDPSLRSAAYFDVSGLLNSLSEFERRSSFRECYWLRAALAVELWLRKLP